MIKLLHTADVHLDAPLKSLALRDSTLRDAVQAASRTAFARIVETALSETVAALLIAGDLFDGAERSARTAGFLTGQLDRLRQAGIAVFYIKGNHDAENPITGEMSFPDNVHVFDGRGGKVRLSDEIWIHGVSFAGRQAPQSLLPKFPAPVPGAVNIAMLHSSLAGTNGHDVYAPCSPAELAAMGFDYWALGHIHKRQIHSQDPWIVMPGIPQGRDIGEAGPKSATLLTVAGGAISTAEVPTSAVEFLPCDVDLSAVETDDAVRGHIRAVVHAAATALRSDAGVLRLRLTGETTLRWQILRDRDVWVETAQAMARETGRLWVETLSIDLSDPSGAGPGATDELAALMAAIRGEEGFAEAAMADVTTILAEIPAHRRGVLMPDVDATQHLTARLAGDGAARLIAMMKGAAD